MEPPQSDQPCLGTAAAAVKYISKKIQKSGMFFDRKKTPRNRPRFTTQSPQLHHD
jgi:hypothetical protein